MRAIILAAGINSRLNGHIDVPKCLLPLGKSTILENQINALMKAGLKKEDILVVVGHKAEMIQKVHKNTLFNPKFKEFNNGYSVFIALQSLLFGNNVDAKEKILILDGDLVYEQDLISKIISTNKENVLVNKKVKYSNELKDEISLVDSNNKVSKLTIPSKEKPLDSSYSKIPLYSYSGIVMLSKKTAAYLFEKLKTSYSGWYTIPFEELVSTNNFHSFEIPSNLKYYFDVDTKEDLDRLSII